MPRRRYIVPLRPTIVRHKGALATAIRRWVTAGRPPSRALVEAFTLCKDERRFAHRLFERRSQFWLFRSNQRLFCGDFVIVDMSPPAPERRRSWVVDLKRGAPLRIGGGGAGVQLVNARRAAVDVAAVTGALTTDAAPELLCGDRRAILAHLGGA